MTMSRSGALTVGATVCAAIMMVFFFKAPFLPVAVGATVGAYIIVRRGRNS